MVKDFFWKKNIIYENGDCMVSQIVEAEKYDFNGHLYSLKSDTIDELCLDLFMETSDRLENSKADLKKIGKFFDSIAKKNNKKMLLDIESSGRKQEWDYNRKIEKSNLIRMVTIDGNSRCKYVDIPLTFDIDVLMSVMEKEFLNLIEEDTYKKIDKILPISDVILKPRAAAYFIHEIIGHPLEYDFIKANRSFFEEKKINQMVLPSFVTIKECPEKATQIGIDFDCIDDSENKLKEKKLIDEGKLTNFITNKRREFGKVKDIYRMHNLILEPVGDNISYQDMMNKKENCILVEGVKFGFYNVLDKTYRLMCGDSYQINNGKIVGKIDNLTILGNAYDLVNRIEKVGADMETCIGRCIKSNQMVVVGMGAPSIQLKQVRVVL